MAPFNGPSKEDVISLLKGRNADKKLPLTLGHMMPRAVIEMESGRWMLRRLVLNTEKARAEGERRINAGGMWMPEMEWQFLEKGPVLAEAGERLEFIEKLKSISWEFS